MNNDPRKRTTQGDRQRRSAPYNGNPPKRRPPQKPTPPQKRRGDENELLESFRDLFSRENFKAAWASLTARMRIGISSFLTHVFLSKERILCGTVTAVLLLLLTLLQTTLFSKITPFGAIPDLMLSFVLALSVTEGRRWGAVWGIIAGVVIESLGVPEFYLMPLLYMLTGYFGGVICRHYLSETAAVRAVLAVGVIPLKGLFTAVYTVLSPISITPAEAFLEIILPEAGATLLLAAPVHLLVYLCLRPFHHTRADMVSER